MSHLSLTVENENVFAICFPILRAFSGEKSMHTLYHCKAQTHKL